MAGIFPPGIELLQLGWHARAVALRQCLKLDASGEALMHQLKRLIGAIVAQLFQHVSVVGSQSCMLSKFPSNE